jgi:hypothetical protein
VCGCKIVGRLLGAFHHGGTEEACPEKLK